MILLVNESQNLSQMLRLNNLSVSALISQIHMVCLPMFFPAKQTLYYVNYSRTLYEISRKQIYLLLLRLWPYLFILQNYSQSSDHWCL